MSEIRAWLEGLELEQYGGLFEANDITPDLARDLSDADLKDLGVPIGGGWRR